MTNADAPDAQAQNIERTEPPLHGATPMAGPTLRGFNAPMHPRMLTALAREVTAFNMRCAGATYQTIADHLGYESRSAAWEAVNRAREKLPEQMFDAAHERHMLTEQIDRLIEDLQTGEIRADIAKTVLTALQAKAKLLGPEKSAKVEVDHRHAHAHAARVVENVERFTHLLGEVADREVQRRLAAREVGEDGPDAA